MREESEWFIPAGTPAPVCSVHVFSSQGDRVFFGSYDAGLQVVDYSDPAKPRRVAEYMAEGTTAWGAEFHKGFVYVGDSTRGLDVFRFDGWRTAARRAAPQRGFVRLWFARRLASDANPQPSGLERLGASTVNAGTRAAARLPRVRYPWSGDVAMAR